MDFPLEALEAFGGQIFKIKVFILILRTVNSTACSNR